MDDWYGPEERVNLLALLVGQTVREVSVARGEQWLRFVTDAGDLWVCAEGGLLLRVVVR